VKAAAPEAAGAVDTAAGMAQEAVVAAEDMGAGVVAAEVIAVTAEDMAADAIANSNLRFNFLISALGR
jgi:tetrahydromethanopterin S-methyltransferase subunit A